jgi:hypothetical protein
VLGRLLECPRLLVPLGAVGSEAFETLSATLGVEPGKGDRLAASVDTFHQVLVRHHSGLRPSVAGVMNTVYRGRDANVRETLRILVQARRAGVTLFARTDGALGLRSDRPPAGALLAVIGEHKGDILALLPPRRVERAKLVLWQLRAARRETEQWSR